MTASPPRWLLALSAVAVAAALAMTAYGGWVTGTAWDETYHVIRLRTFVRVPYRARIPMTRAALMHRDRFRCGYCGGKADTIDHVLPRSRGGGHGWDNCVACCASCNHRKADRLLSEIGWTLRTEPRPPQGRHWRLLSTLKEVDPMWSRYLDLDAA